MANRLADATSPYLLQHAGNPVDWYEWGPEALERARSEDRPILLSVGYAACHWCHVMERESFEDERIARLMNGSFVCVKVDREERPDIDAIYMDAVQAMTGSGGWPMTVFLSPDGRPFYAGTYFPPEDRHGMPGFPKVLEAVAQAWREDRERLLEQGARVLDAIRPPMNEAGEPVPEDVLGDASRMLRRSFDPEHGGFGGAPKFPQPMTLGFLLRMHLRGDEEALPVVRTTIDRMAAGGMRDHVGGGFHRYSTDERWLVPHFEKMLYDNALLARLYLHAWQVTGEDAYREVATDTLDHLLRDMRHPDGGFFSSLDADSEGVEGKYYVWSWEELASIVGEDRARAMGASPEGNWEGSNIVNYSATVADDSFLRTARERSFASDHEQLLEHRTKRIPPATDDKVLAAWNGLAIQALAEAGAALGERRYLDAGADAARFVLSELRPNGRLHRAWRDGRTSGPGFADDHACMAAACLALYEATFDPAWFQEAVSLAEELLARFGDPSGGFFQTATDAEELVIRPKELFDNAVPAAGSVAAELLFRLGLLTGEPRYPEAATGALRAVSGFLLRAPSMFGQALCALDLVHADAREVAIVGERPGRDGLLEVVRTGYRPHLVVAASEEGGAIPPVLQGKVPSDGRAAAYVCRRFVCDRPVTDPGELASSLAVSPR